MKRLAEVNPKIAGVKQKDAMAWVPPNTGSFDEQLDILKDSRLGDDGPYLNANSIQDEFDVLRQVERTTMHVSSYPPVKTTTASPITISTELNNINNALTSTTLEPRISSSAFVFMPPKFVTPGLGSFGLALSSTEPSISAPSSAVPSALIATPHLHTSVPLKSSLNSSIRQEAVTSQPLHSSTKKMPSVASANSLNSTSLLSAPQLSITHFAMYPSQAPVNKIVPVPNAALLPPTVGVGPPYSSNSSNMRPVNSTATPSPTDDTLGCTWDFITNSCKDVFGLNWCTRCHDFGNVFLHNCKCLVKNSSPPVATFLR
ncbi:hypothetical protein Tcan_06000 [Toxocara canis]|uniref:Uncharacterized protein n=1 Tax=Toxocara canis TaxID=6265 RepID=A0A0B2VKG7_TOXCA|nr:hypothetical protein Tcan_06000 [Toxocara canis]